MIDPAGMNGGASDPFGIFFVVILVIIVSGIIFSVVVAARNYGRAKAAGYSPLTMQTDLAVKALDSSLLAPARSLADKLAEVDALFASKTITEAEHAAARHSILAQ